MLPGETFPPDNEDGFWGALSVEHPSRAAVCPACVPVSAELVPVPPHTPARYDPRRTAMQERRWRKKLRCRRSRGLVSGGTSAVAARGQLLRSARLSFEPARRKEPLPGDFPSPVVVSEPSPRFRLEAS